MSKNGATPKPRNTPKGLFFFREGGINPTLDALCRCLVVVEPLQEVGGATAAHHNLILGVRVQL